MDKLDIIIQKLESLEGSVKSLEGSVKSLESGQKELYAMVGAIRHRQEETDAKLDNVAMDVNKLVGKVEGLTTQFAEFREETRNNFKRLDRHNQSIEKDLDRTTERLDDHLANRI